MKDNISFDFSTLSQPLSIGSFVFSVVLSLILSLILSSLYIRNSSSLSNPKNFARIFPLLSIGTTIIITVIKSSLALSLGLVGALSIIRFRTPIKEPEELTYLFLCIGLGLATGANQYKAAVIGLILIGLAVYAQKLFFRNDINNKSIRIVVNNISTSDINNLVNIVSQKCLKVDFNNMSVSRSDPKLNTSIALTIIPRDFLKVNDLVLELDKSFPLSSITILDSNTY